MGESIVLMNNSMSNIPETKNIQKEIFAAFFSPNKVAYVFTPSLQSPSISRIPSGRS